MELNPEHPLTQETHDLWHKFVAILMLRSGHTKVTIGPEDIERLISFSPVEMPCVVVGTDQAQRITLELMTESEARKKAEMIG